MFHVLFQTNGISSRNGSIDTSPKKRSRPSIKEVFGESSDSEPEVGPEPGSGPDRKLDLTRNDRNCAEKYGNFKMKLGQKRELGRPEWKGGWLKSSIETSNIPPGKHISPLLTPLSHIWLLVAPLAY